ncbi:molecular chaperone TorD family protein [Halorhabdus amylolytica]|uniref:molecular chaperone TorD family protein n=1 Tax=Halorhabdus amylolytica TaxID=2559573 RepID=UPI001B7D7F94|nr:molecular chaperone TorD family protein [Halorhabdus amylolytica]
MTETTPHETETPRIDLDEESEAVAVARGRAEVYGLLAAVFDGDVETLAAALEDSAFVRLADALAANVGTDTLDRTDLDREALRIGYDNLFAVPGPHYVPPFASAHADDPSESFESDSPYHEEGAAGEFLGDPAAAGAKAHAATGFEPERGDGVPDHLAVSFEFMSALCAREAELLARDPDSSASEELSAIRASQREALGRLDWLESFQQAVLREDAVEGLFAELATFAQQFITWDRNEGLVTN